MVTHEDNEEVQVRYAASSNITFHGQDSIGYTWGEWRTMSRAERDEALTEFVFNLVDVGIVEDEE